MMSTNPTYNVSLFITTEAFWYGKIMILFNYIMFISNYFHYYTDKHVLKDVVMLTSNASLTRS